MSIYLKFGIIGLKILKYVYYLYIINKYVVIIGICMFIIVRIFCYYKYEFKLLEWIVIISSLLLKIVRIFF